LPCSIIFNVVTDFIRQEYHVSTPENTSKNRKLLDEVRDVMRLLKTLGRSVFTRFGSVAIFGKWPAVVCCGAPNLFAILSRGAPRLVYVKCLDVNSQLDCDLRSTM